MKDLQVFQHEVFGGIRIVYKDGAAWFFATDIAMVLEYANPSRDIGRHIREGDCVVEFVYTNGRMQNVMLINENGLYSFVFKSRKSKIEGAREALLAQLLDFKSVIVALSDFEVPEDLPDMFVYAIREAETGRIKLGISRDPAARLKQLQTGNSQKLELVGTRMAINRFADERAAHIEYSSMHIRGEWFSDEAIVHFAENKLNA